ncbi:MAG TPA: hypothetical protein VJY83_01100 [Thiopseudomonas sp.]|nr:hypothetical protein [Thiopseudomonas sp.]
MIKIILLPIALLLTVAGCTHIPAQTVQNNSADSQYEEVYRYAYMALLEGNWPAYKKLMRKVISMSTSSGAPAEQRAIFWYEYGRASGVTCEWKEAEFALTVAYNLDAKTEGPTHTSLNELGRLNSATQQYKKAVQHFIRGSDAFAKYHEQHPDMEINLSASAQVLEDFAYALEQVGGQSVDVKKLRDAAVKVRQQSIETGEVNEDVTPYGTQCSIK